ncbi:MAG: hypothetical protein L0Z50_24260 [Verrucomicrobiales bacterium]|nr:hypothetical protein [Verrucomicrobiales bacterium]
MPIWAAGSTLSAMHLCSQYYTGTSRQEKARDNVQDRFRAHFMRELARCVRKRVSMAESFGLVFEQTLDCIPLAEDEQRQLYRELLVWAKESAELFPTIHRSYSPQQTTQIAPFPATLLLE